MPTSTTQEPARGAARRRRSLLIGAAALSIGAGPVVTRAATTDLPPLMVPPSPEHHAGKMVFALLVTPDLAAARTFYGALFGWSFQDSTVRAGTLAQAMLGGSAVADIVQRPIPQGRQPAWLALISTADVDRADAAAIQQGGKVVFQPHLVGSLGRESVLADPQGAVFGLLASSSGDPPDQLAQPGDWIWSSLITTDPAAGAAFYKTLLGYGVFELPDTQDAQHLILASDGYARASVNPMPTRWTASHPRWLSYVRVDDTSAAAAKAAALGGRILLQPRIDRHGGKVAVVADPQGAVFGLMEWSDAAATGGAK